MAARDTWNAARFDPTDDAGHYESWFLRANSPTDARAFWLRYTIFCPRGRPRDAVGELWSIVFDGRNDEIVASKTVHPLERCHFEHDALGVRIADAVLEDDAARGDNGRTGWDLRWAGDEPPLLLLDRSAYARSFPRAKALVGRPQARFEGSLTVDGQRIDVGGWIGSQNHNWGSQHTDRYAWGQVAGFDEHPEAFLECATARIKIGPVWTPWVTQAVLRLGKEEYRVPGLVAGARSKGRYDYFHWAFVARCDRGLLRARIEAPRKRFVALRYDDPPGGAKICLNSKLARADLTLERPGRAPLRLRTEDRAAFEILTDDTHHGLQPVV